MSSRAWSPPRTCIQAGSSRIARSRCLLSRSRSCCCQLWANCSSHFFLENCFKAKNYDRRFKRDLKNNGDKLGQRPPKNWSFILATSRLQWRSKRLKRIKLDAGSRSFFWWTQPSWRWLLNLFTPNADWHLMLIIGVWRRFLNRFRCREREL